MFLISNVLNTIGRVYSCLMMPRNVIYGNNSLISFCDGHSVKGKGNVLKFGDGCQLNHCSFIIKGNKNKVTIGKRCRLSHVTFWISGEGNEIVLGDDTTAGRRTQFATLEGTKILIGSDCMFSHDVLMRTSDSHSIVNSEGIRINHAKDIIIGNHCWIGLQCLILKGSILADNCVLAARSTLNKSVVENGCIVGGVPAKILKTGINWDRKRL